MKPRIAPRSSRSKSQDSKRDDKGSKQTKEKQQKVTSGFIKPLAGKVFYLDLPSNKRSETLENDIQTLGGTVEKFFSKDIRYLVSSKPEARHVHRLARESPVPSPESVLSSPRPSSSKEGHRSSSQGPTDPVQVSRGKSLVKKVVKEQEHIQMNKMLSNALEWGVKILHIEEMMAFIEKKKPAISAQQKTNPHTVKKAARPTCYGRTFQKHNATRISKPFVKVEDSSRHYRPFYLHMAQMPVCNFKSIPPASPFQIEERRDSTHGPEGLGGKAKRRVREKREKKRGGYCECCGVKYDKLRAHLVGEKHRAFVAGDHYKQLDALISQLPWPFAPEPTPTQRVKCSVPTSSPIRVSVARDRSEEARGSSREGLQKRATECSSGLGTSCSSRRKRGRELLSGKSKGSSEEVVNFPESSRSKRGSFEWESCPTLLRALVDNLNSDKVSDASATETTPGSQHTESRHHRRSFQRRRHALPISHTVNQRAVVAPCEETLTLSELLQDAPCETTPREAVHVTQQDTIQDKPVDLMHPDSIQEKPVDATQQELIHAKLVGTPQQNSALGEYEDLIAEQDSIQEKPVDITQLESMQAEPVNVTLQDSILQEPEPVKVTVEDQSFRTSTPAVSVQQHRQLPVGTKELPVDSADCCAQRTQNGADVPNPTPNALEDTADHRMAGGDFSPLRRKVRAERSWKRGRSLSLRPPMLEPRQAEDTQGSAKQGLDLWQLFQESDDMQEDFLGFTD